MEYTVGGQDGKALQQVVLTVQFDRAFSDEELASIDRASQDWRTELPRRSVSHPVVIQPQTEQVAFEKGTIATLSFDAMTTEGTVGLGLGFQGSNIHFLDGKNTRWVEIWPKAEWYLSRAISLVSPENKIVSYTAEYFDLFRGKGEYTDFNVANILRSPSRLIPEHIFNRKDNFHFHTGYFETIAEPKQHRILNRINVDLRDNGENRTRDLSIALFHSILPFSKPWSTNQSLPKQILDKGLKNFEVLHDLDKKILLEILSNDISRIVGLLK